MNVHQRLTELKGIFQNHCKNVIVSSPIFNIDIWKIYKENIEFIDGSLLNFYEELYEEDILKYNYEYIRTDTGFFFRYDNENVEEGIKKPRYHLHVGVIKKHAGLIERLPEELKEHKNPHFVAKIDFHQFMGIIIANFFAEDEDECKKILKGLGLVKEKEP